MNQLRTCLEDDFFLTCFPGWLNEIQNLFWLCLAADVSSFDLVVERLLVQVKLDHLIKLLSIITRSFGLLVDKISFESLSPKRLVLFFLFLKLRQGLEKFFLFLRSLLKTNIRILIIKVLLSYIKRLLKTEPEDGLIQPGFLTFLNEFLNRNLWNSPLNYAYNFFGVLVSTRGTKKWNEKKLIISEPVENISGSRAYFLLFRAHTNFKRFQIKLFEVIVFSDRLNQRFYLFLFKVFFLRRNFFDVRFRVLEKSTQVFRLLAS